MVIAELTRLEESFEYGTLGVLRLNKGIFCVTLEPPDQENKANISSIPPQQYKCHRIHSPKFGETFQIMNVPARTNILFHAGNVKQHTLGCIILGQYFDKLRGQRAALNSGATFKKFMGILTGVQEFHLTIKEHY